MKISTLNIILAGVLMGLPYLLTGELAISLGLHIAWNLFEGTIYGFPVSGSAPTRHLIAMQQGGPELWTGGAFGPESGLLAVIMILIGCGLILVWLKWRYKQLALPPEIAQYTPGK